MHYHSVYLVCLTETVIPRLPFPGVLNPSLVKVLPFSSGSAGVAGENLVREAQEFVPVEAFHPHTSYHIHLTYTHHLYLYPLSLKYDTQRNFAKVMDEGVLSVHVEMRGVLSVYVGMTGVLSVHVEMRGVLSVHVGMRGVLSVHVGMRGVLSVNVRGQMGL